MALLLLAFAVLELYRPLILDAATETIMNAKHPSAIEKKNHSLLMRWRIGRCVARVIASDKAHAADFARIEKTILGTLPEGEGAPVLLAACNDLYYREFAVTMLRSIERHGQPERFHLHLCGPSTEVLDDARALAARLSHVDLTVTWDEGYGASLPHVPTIYYTCVRFLIAPLILKATRSPVLCLDIDGIARRPITPAYDEVRDGSDILLIKRPQMASSVRKVLASALGFNPTANGSRFADRLARALAGMLSMRPRYHIDQIAVYRLVRSIEPRGELSTAQMPISFADHDFGEGSAIWTAKGWVRKNSEAYRSEMARIEAPSS